MRVILHSYRAARKSDRIWVDLKRRMVLKKKPEFLDDEGIFPGVMYI
jgi:hypothetical protein